MKKKRMISLIMTIMVMISAVVPVAEVTQAAEGSEQVTPTPEPVLPEVTPEPTPEGKEPVFTVIGSTIKKDKNYFELSMKINPMAEGYLAGGMVLQYDSSIIRPAAWGAEDAQMDMTGRTDWRNVVVVPALAPAELSGKTVLAYEEQKAEPEATPEPTPENPESTATPEPTPEPEPESTPESRAEGEEPEPTPENPEVTPEPTPEETPEPTPEPTPEAAYASKGYLYISSEAAKPMKELPNGGRVITIRFRYVGSESEEKEGNKQRVIEGFESGKIVTLAPDGIAADSPLGQMILYRGNEDIESEYYYTEDAETSEGITSGKQLEKESAYGLKLEQDVESANSGGSDASKFAALVFFDWDESTLLGSMVVDSSMESEELISTINTYTANFMPPGETGGLMDMSDWNDETARSYTVYDSNYPLTSHKGYTFGKWIEYNSEAFTIYGKAVSATSAGTVEEIATPESPDFSNLTGGKILKAAYIANTTMDELITATQREYVVSNEETPDGGYYARYGDSSNYSLKFKVKRENKEKQAVQRTRTTALRVIYNIGTTQVYSLVSMKNIDEQIVEVAAPADADSVVVNVIDTGGVSDWVTGSASRSSDFSVSSKRGENTLGYVIYGTVNYINRQIAEQGATTFAIGIYNEAGLTGVTSSVSSRRNAATYIRKGQALKQEAEGSYYLSQEEMQTAITSKGESYK